MALTKIRGNLQVQDLTVTNSQLAFPDASNPIGIVLAKIEDGGLLVKSNGSVPFTAPVAGVTPTQASHLATKGYVDSAAQGLDTKESVRAISLTNIVLSGAQTIDGTALVAGNRVLVAGQTNAFDNGIYVVSAGAWTRSTDANNNAGVTPGLFTFVEEGTSNRDTGWVLTTDGTIVLGTTPLTFTQFSSAGVMLAGNGLTKSGNTFSVLSNSGAIGVAAAGVNLVLDGTGLSVSAAGLRLSAVTAGQVLIGDGTGTLVPQTISGDVTVTSGGVVTLANGSVKNNVIANGSVALNKLASGVAGQVVVAGAGGVPAYVTVSGDATLSATGDFQLGAASVGTPELALASVTAAKLATDSVTTIAVLNASITLAKLKTIGAAKLIIGTAATGNVEVTLSGDVTVTEAGVVTINPATVVRVADIIKGETPVGALNGVNMSFKLANVPKVGTVDVFVNGILQDPGTGNDYTITGDTITMLYVLTTADKIRASYFK